jgi:hypothetical protein
MTSPMVTPNILAQPLQKSPPDFVDDETRKKIGDNASYDEN